MQTTTNSNVEFNLGKFNIPTILGLLTVIGMLLNITNNRTETDTKVALRLDAIESSRIQARADVAARFTIIETNVSKLGNLDYRVTNVEGSVKETNTRLDRQSDAIGKLSEGIAGVSSDLKLLTQRLELVVPFKKSELYPLPLGETPKELKQ